MKWKTTVIAFTFLIAAILALAVDESGSARGDIPETSSTQPVKPRTYRMGFSIVPPRPDTELALKGFEIWSKYSDAAIQHQDVPWTRLLAGESAEDIVREDTLPLINLYKERGLTVAITVEALDGLDRSMESPKLRRAKRSITEPEVQKLYRDYVTVLATSTKPNYFGLVAETNLFKANAPEKTYKAMVRMVNDAAADISSATPDLPLYVSVQVDEVWGRLGKHQAEYVGIDDVFEDFPFIDVLGVSSYPIFGWKDPDDIPADYFSRLVKGRDMPVIMVEGGWASTSTKLFETSAGEQARWIARLGVLLDEVQARFVGLLIFADLDVKTFNEPRADTLALFASMGLANGDFSPKLALDEWKRLFERPNLSPDRF